MIICKTCLKTEKIYLSCFFVNIKSKPRLPKSLYEIFIFMDTKSNGSVDIRLLWLPGNPFLQTWGTLSRQGGSRIYPPPAHMYYSDYFHVLDYAEFAYAEKSITLRLFFVFFVVLLSHNYLVISLFTSVLSTLNSITNCFH